MTLIILNHLLEFLTALTATITWKKYRSTKERNFIYFFWIVFLVDILGELLATLTSVNNAFLYNSLFIFYFIFLIFWYCSLLKTKNEIKYLFLVYLLIVIFTFWKQNFFYVLHSIHFTGGSLILLFLALMYFNQTLQSDAILTIKNSLPFWITLANIIYFVGMLPLTIFQEYMNVSYDEYNIVLTFVNFITYSCYILGFIWTKNKL